MVRFALPLVALAMTGPAAAALGSTLSENSGILNPHDTSGPRGTAIKPATSTTSGATFSFEQWVDDLIANPDTALSVDEAIAAAQAAEAVGSAGGLQKRANCDQTWARASGRDAVACVNRLASRGQDGTMCTMGAREWSKSFCHIGGARIWAGKSYHARVQSVNCQDVARTAGKIFDTCWRSDDTISGSEFCITNDQMQINLGSSSVEI